MDPNNDSTKDPTNLPTSATPNGNRNPNGTKKIAVMHWGVIVIAILVIFMLIGVIATMEYAYHVWARTQIAR